MTPVTVRLDSSSPKVLPFGACASVYAFNRISRSLLHLLVRLGKITGGVFYDDFPMLEVAESSRLASMVAEHMLSCLGWLFAKGNDKGRPFELSFDVLGVRLCPEFPLIWLFWHVQQGVPFGTSSGAAGVY